VLEEILLWQLKELEEQEIPGKKRKYDDDDGDGAEVNEGRKASGF
jgi:hypothetical protein